MTTDIAVASNGTLALTGDQIEWTPVQRAALAHLGIDKAPHADQQVFMHVAQRVGLDPFAKQIWMIPRGGKWTIQTAIDGFRLIADRRPEYAGQVGPQWCGDDGVWREFWASKTPPVAARVGILRRDWAEPVWGVAMFAEFTANNQMWREKGAHQLAKCAEALAIRKAFPNDLSGLYTDDEMASAGERGRGRRGVVVEQDAQPVTAAELTGQPSRDWDGEVSAAIRDMDLDTLRDLYRQAKGHDDVRERIAASVEAIKQAQEDGPGEPVDAEIVDEPAPQPEPTADDAATGDEFFRHPGEDQP